YLNDIIFKFESNAAVSFSGFLATLILFWILMLLVGLIFQKLSHLSGLGPIDKLFGFVLGSSKFFLIASVISHATYNIQALKTSISPLVEKSILFPILTETGSYIMKIDPVTVGKDIDISINKPVKDAQNYVESTIDESAKKMVEDIKTDLVDGNGN
ncbi:MAG: CvpA family protein, partial [Campylobacterota bacterium]|nr:CvpA family protein [Campylobacterota bacterium]